MIIISLVSVLFAQENPSEAESESAGSQKPVYTAEQQRLRLTPQDIRLVPENDLPSKGYHLYIRKRPGIESVLLTETTKDPEGKNDSFAYRATEYNPINGDEIRYLDGKALISEYAKYSLVDSSAEDFPAFGKAFHIYIPSRLEYGYPWERHGSVEIGKGTFINIRTFEKKFADYSGNYMDSPFMFDLERRKKPAKPVVKQKPVEKPKPAPLPEPEPLDEVEAKEEPEPEPEPEIPEPEPEEITVLTDDYNPVASDKFQELADKMFYSKGPDSIIEDIMGCLDDLDPERPNDVVFAIDATGSMKNDIDKLKLELIPTLLDRIRGKYDVRLGLLFYRDYGDNFNFKGLPVKFFAFTDDFDSFNKNLNALLIKGKEGGDIPEAVYEALYASAAFYTWKENSFRKIILIGDAEPHPKPRGTRKYSKEFVASEVKRTGAVLEAILLPQD